MNDARKPQANIAGSETSPATANIEQPSPIPSPAAQKWLEENREAIKAFNEWYERNGSPLDEYRAF